MDCSQESNPSSDVLDKAMTSCGQMNLKKGTTETKIFQENSSETDLQ